MSASDGRLICAIRGPITLITVGVLFALNNFTPYRFDQTWPVLLIVFGLLSILRRASQPVPPPPQYAPPPPYDSPSGGYRDSRYQQNTPPPMAGDAAARPPAGGTA